MATKKGRISMKISRKSKPGKVNMSFNEIRKMAKGMGINTNWLKKPDVIRSIQRAEYNIDCFGTQRVEHCNEDKCLWRNDCISLNHNFPPNNK